MLNPIEEQKFDTLKAMCRELKVPAPPEIMIGLKVHDKNGILTFDDVQRGHSWTRNYWNFLFSCGSDAVSAGAAVFAAGSLTGKNTSGNIRADGNLVVMRSGVTKIGAGFNNDAANANYGIVLGSGTTAEGVNLHTLATLIAHGNTAGLLYYQAMTGAAPSYTGTTWKSTFTRIFNNNSGGQIDVKEAGLYWRGYLFYSIAPESYMMERTLLGATVEIPNGAQLTVTYEISMDFSAID
jgi:hypothetical protein